MDAFRLMIDPLLRDRGKRLLPDDGVARTLRLIDSQAHSTVC